MDGNIIQLQPNNNNNTHKHQHRSWIMLRVEYNLFYGNAGDI